MANKATAAQKRMFAKAAEFGCLPCHIDGHEGVPATIHHAHGYGNRNHDITYPLCVVHHLYQHAVDGIPNREKNPIEFREKFGTDLELYREMLLLLGEVDYENLPF